MEEERNPFSTPAPSQEAHNRNDNGSSTRQSYQNPNGPYYSDPSSNPNGRPPYKPDSYLILSIISTIFGCLPLGIVAIIYASKVENLYFNGRYEEACHASNEAKKWSIISLIVLAAMLALYFIFIFVSAGLILTGISHID